MTHRGRKVDTTRITNVALLTVEGENDDISGVGQTHAAQTICINIPDDRRMHYVQPDVGHYGVFNGSRFRREIAPRILDFMHRHALANRNTSEATGKPQSRQSAKVISASFGGRKAR
jgi:poly(3-hydroxybutyrate) depolymerase